MAMEEGGKEPWEDAYSNCHLNWNPTSRCRAAEHVASGPRA